MKPRLTPSVTPSPPEKGEADSEFTDQKLPKPRKDNQHSILSYVISLDTPENKKTSIGTTTRFKSKRSGYGVEWRDAMLGDLVIDFASDIKHLVIKECTIHRHFILLGIVKSFVNVR